MKRFLFLLMFAFAIIIPTTLVEAADVPDFVEISDGNLSYRKNQLASDGGTWYFYEAKNLNYDLAADYVGRYIRLLTSKYNFVQKGYWKRKFDSKRLRETRDSETWTFIYNGSKKVKSLSKGCHIELRRIRERDKKRARFEVKVAQGLVFAGNYAAPRTPKKGEKSSCESCNGSGRCINCEGRGYYYMSSFDDHHPCGVCRGTGKCIYCDGKGEF